MNRTVGKTSRFRISVVLAGVLALLVGLIGVAGSPAGADTSAPAKTVAHDDPAGSASVHTRDGKLLTTQELDEAAAKARAALKAKAEEEQKETKVSTETDGKPDTKAADAKDALLAIVKEVSQPTVEAGKTFNYDIQVSCSSITTPCKDVVVTDKFEAGFIITPPDSVSGGAAINFDQTTNTLTVSSATMAAGSTLNFRVGVTVPADTDIKTGTVVPNTAKVEASNADTQTDSANITVNVVPNLDVAATKSLNPGGGIAGNGQVVKAELGVKNNSTTVSEVKQLRIKDESPEFFNVFDFQSAKVTQFPKGANRVAVSICKEAGPCADNQWINGQPQAGPGITLPDGVNAADVTGLLFTFVNDKGEKIAEGKDADRTGKVEVEFKGRTTFRGNNEPLQVTSATTVYNKVVPSVFGKNSQNQEVWHNGPQNTAPYTLNPNIVKVESTKAFYVDPKNDFTNGGEDAIQNQNTPVSTVVMSTNKSGFPISNITITDPKEGTSLGFFKPTQFRLTFPAGAAKAHVVIKCSDNSVHEKDYPPAENNKLIASPCPGGTDLTSASAKFESKDAKTPEIKNNEIAGLSLTGALDGKQKTGNSPLRNIAWIEGDNPIDGSGSFSGEVQDTLTVRTDTPSSGGQSKTTGGVGTIVPGQPLRFNMAFNNSGYVPLEHVILADPKDPSKPSPSWETVQVTKITVDGSGVDSTNPPKIELWDPTANAYVAYNAGDAALLERAKGFRVSTTTPLLRNQTINVRLDVVVRDKVEPGATFTNCMNVSLDGGKTWQADRCAGPVEVKEGDVSANLQKMFVPGEVARTLTSGSAATVTTKLRVSNGGPLYLKTLTVTDKGDAAGGTANFFDMVDVSSTTVYVNRPPGATHTKIEFCEFGEGCAANTWVLSNNFSTSTSLAIANTFKPGQAGAKRIGGIKVTFATKADGNGEALILPTTNFPASGNCAEASVCFNVKPRVALFTDDKTPVPDTITNGITGEGQSVPRTGSEDGKFPIPQTDSSFKLNEGKRKLDLVKRPNGNISPGSTFEFELVYTNTGSGIVKNPLLVDRLPDLLDLDTSFGLNPSEPYTVSYAMADSRPEPGAPVTTISRGSGGQVQKLALKWNDWDMLPGDKVTVKIKVKMMPGATTGMKLENQAGVTGDGFSEINPDECTAPTTAGGVVKGTDSSGYFGDAGQLFCTSKAYVTTQEGNAFASYKWVAGTLPWFYIPGNVGSSRPAFEKIDQTSCPTIEKNGRTYTRYPCVALIHPGEQFEYILRLANAGTNPVKEIRIADSLPHEGDSGVWVPSPRMTEWSPRPTLAGAVSDEGPDGMTVKTGYSNSVTACVEDLKPGDPNRCDFSGSAGSDTGSFFTQILFEDGKFLPPGGSVDLELTMDSPKQLDKKTELPIAWNSFAQSAWAREANGKDKYLLPAEPEKVGVGMMFSRLDIEKAVSGFEGDNDHTSPFPVEYKCRFDGEDLNEGTGQVVPGETTTLTEAVFPDVECDIWETDARGAESSATKENPLKVTMPKFDPQAQETPESIGFGKIENVFPEPTPPEPTPSETTGSGSIPPTSPSGSGTGSVPPTSPTGPTESPSNDDDQGGILPHTGGGWAALAAIIGLGAIGIGTGMRRAGRNREH